MIIFRYMEKNDLERVSEIYNKCFGKCEKCKYRSNILLAIFDNIIVGMVTIDYLFDNFLCIKTAYINNVSVDPDYQNNNIGYLMMTECERVCKKNNCDNIMLTSNSNRKYAQKLYNKLGFELYDTNVFKKNI